MKTPRLLLLAAVSTLACGAAHAQFTATNEHGIPDAPTLLTNVHTQSTGTMLKKPLHWKSTIPLNKTWSELTPQQQADFRAQYASIRDTDEPPFPIQGMKPVFSAIQKGQDVMQVRGALDFTVTVGADGKATNVEGADTISGVNAREMSNYVASVLMMAKYKPAVCSGKPCEMQFPFKLKL